jgi:hypothetical protein
MNASTLDLGARPLNGALHTALLTLEGVLAVAFGAAGILYLVVPYGLLSPWRTSWPMQIPLLAFQIDEAIMRVLGAASLLGAAGLALSASTRRPPSLSLIAAATLAIVVLLSAAFDLPRGVTGLDPIRFALAAALALVAWGRFKNEGRTP